MVRRFLLGNIRRNLVGRDEANGAGAEEGDAGPDVDFYRQLLAAASASADRLPVVPGRVVLVNAGLAAGGAERQVANTLIGLRARGVDASFLGEYLNAGPNLNFHRPALDAGRVPVAGLDRRISFADCGFASVASEVADLLAKAPQYLIEEILNLAEEFLQRCPEIVHAWQDSTSIKVGIAAVIAGVPKIVLSSRNVNPTHFKYHQPYMRPAYIALSERSEVAFINNSEAGVASYCDWLGLPPSKYRVIRNGVDFRGVTQRNDGEKSAFRRKLGIPAASPVVGAIFRLWPEKRPRLWLDAATIVARSRPDIHFVIVGDGPLKAEVEEQAGACGLGGRLHLVGEQADIVTPLEVFDVFLLTSQFEGTPNVVLEAQWLGLPVVATKAGGTPEAVDEGRTGKIVDPTPQALAGQVLATLEDGRPRAERRSAGQAFVGTRFGFERMIDETLDLYGFSSRPGPEASRADGPVAAQVN